MYWTLKMSGPSHRTTAMVCLMVTLAAFRQTQTKQVTHAVPIVTSIQMCGSSVNRDTYYCDWDILLISLMSAVRCSYSTLMPTVRCSYNNFMSAARCRDNTLMPAVRCSYSTLMLSVRCSYSILMPAVRCSYGTLMSAVRCGYGTLMSAVRCSYGTLMPAVRCRCSTVVFKLSKGKWQIVSQVVFEDLSFTPVRVP